MNCKNPDMGNNFGNRKGIALIVTLLMLTIMLILAMTFLTASSRDYIYARYVVMRNQAFYLAESGVEYAQLQRINWIEYPHEEEVEFSGGKFSIKVDDLGNGAVDITSIGKCGVFIRGIRVIYGRDGTIQSWEEF